VKSFEENIRKRKKGGEMEMRRAESDRRRKRSHEKDETERVKSRKRLSTKTWKEQLCNLQGGSNMTGTICV
jgi:hypothetical protein